jgi:hypothetical protein
LRLRDDAAAYVGQVFVGVEDKDNPKEAPALGRHVQLLITGEAELVTPDNLKLDHANLPYVPVRIEAARPRESVSVHVRPDFDPKGFDLDLRVVRPRLTLQASPLSIQGFGLETTDLTIGVEGATLPAEVNVRLSSDRGRPTPTVVPLGATGLATASLRSIGLGNTVVRADHGLLEPATPVTVAILFPWAFAIAVVLGGTVGGMLRYAGLKAQKVQQIRIVPLVWHAVLGIAAGLVVTTAYAVGINLLNLQPEATTGEALVFALAAIGALASERVVKTISA